MANKVLISGYVGFSNFGDDAIFSILTRFLKEQGLEVQALSSNPELTERDFGVKAFKYNNPFAILKAFCGVDTLISGGGSLLQNSTSNKSLIYYLLIILLAKFLGKKVVIFAQGVGPIKGALWQSLTRFILNLCDVVTVRNSFSQRLLSKWGIESKLVCDPVFECMSRCECDGAVEAAERSTTMATCDEVAQEQKDFIGIQLRPYSKLEPNFVKNLAKGIAAHFPNEKIRVFTFQNDMDEKICSEFLKHLNSQNAQIVKYQSIEQIESDFSTLKYLFAMRFHACLLGLKSGIKTLPLSYDEKVTNLAQDFNVEYVDASVVNDFEVLISEFLNAPLLNGVNVKKFNWSYLTDFLLK